MKSAFLALLAVCYTTIAFAQTEYKDKLDKDGINVTYLWRPSDKKVADSPLELDIVMKNTTDKFLDLTFTVAFLDAGEIMEESAPIKLCFKPGQTLKGKKFGLCLISESTSNEQIQSDNFDWTLEEFTVKETNGCN